jgi:hypothetical protein
MIPSLFTKKKAAKARAQYIIRHWKDATRAVTYGENYDI